MIKRFSFSVVFILFIVVLVVMLMYSDKQEVSLYRCVDGDTAWFLIQGKKEKVRFLAIDTPEIAHDSRKADVYGDSAKDYTCKMLKNAQHIDLEYDEGSSKKDKYGRVLAWVFVDDKNLNYLLVKKGYAMVRYVYGDYRYLDMLCDSQEEAYQHKLGLWKYDSKEYSDNYCLKR